MGMFGKIMSKLGFGKDKVEAVEQKAAAAKPAKATDAVHADRIAKLRSDRARRERELPVVDVMAKLEMMAEQNPAELNWRQSIVDLLKLLDMDSSFEARSELAAELGCPEDLMDESAEMNTWLHKALLIEIAENGGNVPDELLD